MKDYNLIDQQIHQLSQIIAKFGRTFAEKKDDDSHTNLGFDALGFRLFGRWVNTEKGEVILSLNLEHSTFEISDKEWNSLLVVELDGKTQKHIEEEIEVFLPSLKLDSKGFRDNLHFEIPVYDFADKAFARFTESSVRNWTITRALANETCMMLKNHFQLETETRIWPHHFDTGIYFEAKNDLGFGFGLAMRDDMLEAPYFYISAYGLNGKEVQYPTGQPMEYGQWIVNENWKGATLKLTSLSHRADMEIQTFLKEAINWFMKD